MSQMYIELFILFLKANYKFKELRNATTGFSLSEIMMLMDKMDIIFIRLYEIKTNM